jgi:hypothetical protein
MIADMLSGGVLTSGPIGQNNCIELVCPHISQRGRTFYMSCETLSEAKRWLAAIENNLKVMAADMPEGERT